MPTWAVAAAVRIVILAAWLNRHRITRALAGP